MGIEAAADIGPELSAVAGRAADMVAGTAPLEVGHRVAARTAEAVGIVGCTGLAVATGKAVAQYPDLSVLLGLAYTAGLGHIAAEVVAPGRQALQLPTRCYLSHGSACVPSWVKMSFWSLASW